MDDNDAEVLRILRDARKTFDVVQTAYLDLASPDARRRVPALRTLIVFSRAVTNVLQKLRHRVPDFDEWYQPKVEFMKAEPIARFFYRMRSEILKDGVLDVVGDEPAEVTIDDDRLRVILTGPRPAYADRFVIDWTGERHVASWVCLLPDGSARRVDVDFPGTQTGHELSIPGAPYPDAWRGIPIAPSLVNSASAYAGYMGELVYEAEMRWIGHSPA